MMAKEAALAPANARAARVQRSKWRVTDWFVVRVLRALTRCVPQTSAISGVSSIAPTNRLRDTRSPLGRMESVDAAAYALACNAALSAHHPLCPEALVRARRLSAQQLK